MCFVWISEQTAIISLYNINWLVWITETDCVYSAVRTGCLNMIQVKLHSPLVTICTGRFNIQQFHVQPTQLYLSFLCGSENKQPLFPYTALTDWFLGAFRKLRKLTVSFVMPVCPSVHMEQLSSHWTDFHGIWYLSNFSEPCLENSSFINLLAPDFFFLILAHSVYKMWIIQEPNTLELWNRLHFEGKKRKVYTVFKIFSIYICLINI